jgi:hypothetical protein
MAVAMGSAKSTLFRMFAPMGSCGLRYLVWRVFVGCMMLVPSVLFAQTPIDSTQTDSLKGKPRVKLTVRDRYQRWLLKPQTAPDDTIYAGSKRIPDIRSTDRWDISVGRSFLIYYKLKGGLPFSSSFSGAWYFGFTWNFYALRNLSIRTGLGLTYFNVTGSGTGTQLFPLLDSSSYNFQSVRALYLDLPIGVNVVLSRDKKKRIETMLEAGVTLGVLIFGQRYQQRASDKASISRDNDPALDLFRSTVYLKLRFKFVGVLTAFRLTPVYNPSARFTKQGESLSYSKFGGLEIGLFFAL